MFMQCVKDGIEVFQMFAKGGSVYKYVVKVNNTKVIEKGLKYLIHEPHESAWSVT